MNKAWRRRPMMQKNREEQTI